ncbi:MAG TPA: efflux RND transporter permease subunit [Ignavibacteriales bacterium]|nr:efflux RND transporter permease subunit [Ignavibacteriales bacterium]
MSVTKYSINRPVALSMFYLGITILGVFAFNKLGIDLLPEVNIPHLIVQTTYQSATPEEIEKLITEPLEAAAGTVTGVKNITSVSKEGISVISLDLVWGTNIDYAILSLREKLDNVRFSLPKDAGRPTIIRADPSSHPIMTLVLAYKDEQKNNSFSFSASPVTGNKGKISYVDQNSSQDEIKRLIDLKEAARVVFKRRLEQVPGVAQAIITGGLEREILVEADPQKLYTYSLSFKDITNALKSSNINLSAGTIMKGQFRYSLRTIGEYKSIEEIKNTAIKKNSDGSVILLLDVANVKESFKEREGLTRLNGNETLGILINKEPESNTVEIAKMIRNTVSSLNKEFPEFNISIVSDQSEFIENAISNVKQEILWGGILAFIVLFFFLGSIRNIFIIGITIPSSLILTFLLMYLFNINFNIVSLGGIALGVGMLLDNAIIVIENVTRFRELGHSSKKSALLGAREVSMPVIASTLTTIAVFFPMIFMKGIVGELFKDQSLAVSFSLVSSIITALTLIPMLASRENTLFKPDSFGKFKYLSNYINAGGALLNKYTGYFFSKANKVLDLLIEKYEFLLKKSLENKKKVLLLTLGLIVLTILAVLDMKKEFIPEAPTDEFTVELVYPSGTSLKGNAEITAKIEGVLLGINGVKDIISNIGRVNEFDYLNREQVSVNKSNLMIKLYSSDKYYEDKQKVELVLGNLKGIKYTIKEVKSTFTQVIRPSENDIAIAIKNKNIDDAYASADRLVKKLNQSHVNGISEVRIGVERGEPEYRMVINREKCLACGITINDVAEQIVSLVKGNEATFFTDFDKKVAINVRPADCNRDNINKLISNYVQNGEKKIPIKEVVDYKLTESYDEIWHEGQGRTVYVYASVNGSSIDKVIGTINSIIGSLPEKPGETITAGGTNEEIRSSFFGLYVAIIISALLMFMVLASEFESLLFPFIIIFSVPLGLIGGILLLYILGESISIISLMGLVILIGIADNDAVVKVEFILRKRKEGYSVKEAILLAGKDRFRPIVMNTFTVIFGLIPMMVGIGAATQLRISLSLAIAGGLLSSTFLTLIVIPVLYVYLERYSRKKIL